MTKSTAFSAGMILLALGSAVAQEVPAVAHSSQSPETTFRTSSSLVLVQVVALKHGLPDKTLQQDDFQVFDNGQLVSIKTFDSGAQFSTRPLALWFVVQCNMQGWGRRVRAYLQGRSIFSSPL
jgi:hypothetical protein